MVKQHKPVQNYSGPIGRAPSVPGKVPMTPPGSNSEAIELLRNGIDSASSAATMADALGGTLPSWLTLPLTALSVHRAAEKMLNPETDGIEKFHAGFDMAGSALSTAAVTNPKAGAAAAGMVIGKTMGTRIDEHWGISDGIGEWGKSENEPSRDPKTGFESRQWFEIYKQQRGGDITFDSPSWRGLGADQGKVDSARYDVKKIRRNLWHEKQGREDKDRQQQQSADHRRHHRDLTQTNSAFRPASPPSGGDKELQRPERSRLSDVPNVWAPVKFPKRK
jgi:hypothetical protein